MGTELRTEVTASKSEAQIKDKGGEKLPLRQRRRIDPEFACFAGFILLLLPYIVMTRVADAD